MAKRKAKKKLSTLTVVMLAVALVGAAIAITGLFLEWTNYKIDSVFGQAQTDGMTLEDWAQMNDWDQPPEYSIVMQLFAWVAGILAAAGFLLVLVRMLVNVAPVRLIGTVAGIGAILCGILALVFTFLTADSFIGGVDFGDVMKGGTQPSVGAYLLAAGAVVGGIGALGGSKK